MTSPESQPRTAAGRRLLRVLNGTEGGIRVGAMVDAMLAGDILAIEAEAAAQAEGSLDVERNPSAEPYYLSMDCPVCGRRRMQWDGKVLSCEKCTTSSGWDGFTKDRYDRLAAEESHD